MDSPCSLCVSIGGVSVKFIAPNSSRLLVNTPGFRVLPCHEEAEILVQVIPDDYPVFSFGTPPIYSAERWAFFRVEGKPVLVMEPLFADHDNSRQVAVIHSKSAVDLYVGPKHHEIKVPPTALDGLLAMQFLAFGYGAMVHACGLKIAGRGALFCGPSGVGKSTTAGLWLKQTRIPVQLLSDERIAVRRQTEGMMIHGTPWYSVGYYSTPESANLAAIFLLNQAPVTAVEPVNPLAAYKEMLPLLSWPVWDADGMAFTLEFLEALCSSVPIYRLNFTPDLSAVEAVWEQIGS